MMDIFVVSKGDIPVASICTTNAGESPQVYRVKGNLVLIDHKIFNATKITELIGEV